MKKNHTNLKWFACLVHNKSCLRFISIVQDQGNSWGGLLGESNINLYVFVDVSKLSNGVSQQILHGTTLSQTLYLIWIVPSLNT